MEAKGPLREAIINGVFRDGNSNTYNPWGNYEEPLKDGLHILWMMYNKRGKSNFKIYDIKYFFLNKFKKESETTLNGRIKSAIQFLTNPKGYGNTLSYIEANTHTTGKHNYLDSIHDISLSNEGKAICILLARKQLEIKNVNTRIKKSEKVAREQEQEQELVKVKVKVKVKKILKENYDSNELKDDIILDEKFTSVFRKIGQLKKSIMPYGNDNVNLIIDNLQNEIVVTGNSIIKHTEISLIIMMLEIFNNIDPYTAGHQYNVAYLVKNIAMRILKINDDNYNELLYQYTIAALLHDIGKFTIPISLLTKPGNLNKEEKQLINAHPTIGSNLIKSFSFTPFAKNFPDISMIIEQHHELLNGKGYPQMISGDAICQGARIVTVADVVEAMLNHRPYRPFVMKKSKVLKEIDRCSKGKNKQFDRTVVKICDDIVSDPDFCFPISSEFTYDWNMADERVKKKVVNFISDVSLS